MPSAAQRNAELNGLQDRARFSLPPSADERFDLVVANLERPALLENAAAIAGALAPQGTLIVTGFLADQAEAVLAALSPLCPVRSVEDEGWALYVLRSPRGEGE